MTGLSRQPTPTFRHFRYEVEVQVPLSRWLALLNAHKVGTFNLTDGQTQGNLYAVKLEVDQVQQAVFVSRPSERIYDARGVLLGWLPREPDHMPDDYIGMRLEAWADGSPITWDVLQELLAVATPADKAREFRERIRQLEMGGGGELGSMTRAFVGEEPVIRQRQCSCQHRYGCTDLCKAVACVEVRVWMPDEGATKSLGQYCQACADAVVAGVNGSG